MDKVEIAKKNMRTRQFTTPKGWVNFKIGCLDYMAGIDLVKTPWGQFRWGEIFEIPKEYRGWGDLEFPVPVCPEDQTAATLINWSFFPAKTYGLFSGETIQDENGKTWTIQVDRYNDGTACFGWGDPEEIEAGGKNELGLKTE